MTGATPQEVKRCATCKETKSVTDFHKAGVRGYFTYCKRCVSLRPRKRNDTPEQKRKWNVKRRYGITIEEAIQLLVDQGGLCAICREVPRRACIDHDHNTGKVRGILCHRCNVMAGAFDDSTYRHSALRYLGIMERL